MKLPAILLEDDADTPPVLAGPGRRYVAPPSPAFAPPPPPALPAPIAPAEPEPELEIDYGIGRLWLTVRDPRTLHAYWDLTPAQLAAAAAGLRLRIYSDAEPGPHFREVAFAPGARSCFVELDTRDAAFVGEIGFAGAAGVWQTLARSAPVLAPPVVEVGPEEVRFVAPAPAPESATATPSCPAPPPPPQAAPLPPVETPARLPEIALPPAPPDLAIPPSDLLPTLEPVTAMPGERATQPSPASGMPETAGRLVADASAPEFVPSRFVEPPRSAVYLDLPVPAWTAAQAQAFAELTLEVQPELASPSSATLAAGDRAGRLREVGLPRRVPGGPSSPGMGFGVPEAGRVAIGPGAELRRGFWFNVNAELVVYGATEPDARVMVDGLPVKLRPDGTFTLRFALPDGAYALAAEAVSADGADSRQAGMRFARQTAYRGDVGRHPTDPVLAEPPRQKGGG